MFACAISTDEFKCFHNVLQANTHSMFVTRPVGLCQCLFPGKLPDPGAAVQSDQTARRGRGTLADTGYSPRWRRDKKPQECTFDQLEIVPPHELTTIFASGR